METKNEKSGVWKKVLSPNVLLVCIACMTSTFFLAMKRAFFASTITPLGFPVEYVQYATSALTAIAFISMPLVSWINDKKSPKMLFWLSVVLEVIGAVLSTSTNMWVVFAAHIIASVGPTWAAIALMSMLNFVLEKEYRKIAMIIYTASQFAGGMLAPMIGKACWNVGQTTFYYLAAGIALAGAILFTVTKPVNTVEAKPKAKVEQPKGLWNRFEKSSIPSCILAIIHTIPNHALETYIFLFGDLKSVTTVALFLTLKSAASLVVAIVGLGPWIMKRGLKEPMMVGYTLSVVAFVMLVVWPTNIGFVVAGILEGLAHGIKNSTTRSYAMLGVPLNRTGAAAATNTAAIQIGGVISGFAVAALFGFLGLEYLYLGLSVFYAIDILLIAFVFGKDIKGKEERIAAEVAAEKAAADA